MSSREGSAGYRQAGSKSVNDPRRGLFPAAELLNSPEARQMYQEFPDLDRQCIIRFPEDVAKKLRERLSCPGAQLGLTLNPTSREDCRVFHVAFEEALGDVESTRYMTGVLSELPCIIESYKTLDGDLMFKSGDISQIIYVFDPDNNNFDISVLRDKTKWEWKSGGLTPPTHRIRSRKFRNFEVFERPEISMGEREILEILRGFTRDVVFQETATEYELHEQLEQISLGDLSTVVSVIPPNQRPFDDAASDLSDKLFQEVHQKGNRSGDESEDMFDGEWMDDGDYNNNGGLVQREAGPILPETVDSLAVSNPPIKYKEEKEKKEKKHKQKKAKKQKKHSKKTPSDGYSSAAEQLASQGAVLH